MAKKMKWHAEHCSSLHGGDCCCGFVRAVPVVKVQSLAWNEVLDAISRRIVIPNGKKDTFISDVYKTWEKYLNTAHPKRNPEGERFDGDWDADDGVVWPDQ